MPTLGKGNIATPSDEIGLLRSDKEGYATLESVMRAGAQFAVHPDPSNRIQVIGSPPLLYVAPFTGPDDSIDDNPHRLGDAWVAGDRMAVARQASGSVDEQADVEAYLASLMAGSAIISSTMTTIVAGVDSIDDNPARLANAWVAGDNVAVAQPGSQDEKAEFDLYLASTITSSPALPPALQSVLPADSVDDNPARPGDGWAPGDHIAVAQSGGADEKADVDAYLASLVNNGSAFPMAITGLDSIDDNPARAGSLPLNADMLAIAQPGSVDEKVDAAAYLAALIQSGGSQMGAINFERRFVIGLTGTNQDYTGSANNPHVRLYNTVFENTLPGASLVSNTDFIIPAGRYLVHHNAFFDDLIHVDEILHDVGLTSDIITILSADGDNLNTVSGLRVVDIVAPTTCQMHSVGYRTNPRTWGLARNRGQWCIMTSFIQVA